MSLLQGDLENTENESYLVAYSVMLNTYLSVVDDLYKNSLRSTLLLLSRALPATHRRSPSREL